MSTEPNIAIPARDFLNLIAQPSVIEFTADSQNFRKTVIAVWAISALVEHICWENFEEEMRKDCRKFLKGFASQQPAYAVIQEASNCLKHAVRTGKRKASGSASVKIRGRGWGEAEFGTDEYGGTPIALVDYIEGQAVSIKHAIQTIEPWIQTQLEKTD